MASPEPVPPAPVEPVEIAGPAAPDGAAATGPPSERTTVRRGAHRADYRPDTVREILRAGTVAHVGVSGDDGPIVLPMAYGVVGDHLYLHGASANALLRGAHDVEICVTVTLLDGLVIARSPFHDSMNYRCVVMRGRARTVTDAGERMRALRAITDHVVEHFDQGRPPNDAELRRTRVLAVGLAEASAKVRRGDPVDDAEDLDGPHWAGTVAVATTFGAPLPAADLTAGIAVPTTVAALGGTSITPA